MASRLSKALSQLGALLAQPPAPASVQTFPLLRNFVLDVMAEGRRKNTIHLMFEVELTPIRQHLADYARQHGEPLSMTAYLSKSLAEAIQVHKHMHAYRQGKSRLIVFDEVDLAVMVERDVNGHVMPVNIIVRDAGRKPMQQVACEIRSAKTAPLGDTGPLTALDRQFFQLPRLLRKAVWWYIRRDPQAFKQIAGTVAVTSMGMHAQGPAVVIPVTPMTLTLSIGASYRSVKMHNGNPVECEMLQMNFSADHDIIDGAPLMRFVEYYRQVLALGMASGNLSV
ncbi:MAG: 2-oxo acid dehydrogenase subunit E2 [Burkholderiales bacterium]